MPVEATVGRRTYTSTDRDHAEELLFNSGRHDDGDLAVELNAWPCTGERHHNCHALFIRKSANRRITVTVTQDHGGYAANHHRQMGTVGTITYNNGMVTYR